MRRGLIPPNVLPTMATMSIDVKAQTSIVSREGRLNTPDAHYGV